VAIFVKVWGWDLFTLGTIDCIKNDAPLGAVDGGVLKEVVKENLGNVFIFGQITGKETAYIIKL
jgi:hypothetical protein